MLIRLGSERAAIIYPGGDWLAIVSLVRELQSRGRACHTHASNHLGFCHEFVSGPVAKSSRQNRALGAKNGSEQPPLQPLHVKHRLPRIGHNSPTRKACPATILRDHAEDGGGWVELYWARFALLELSDHLSGGGNKPSSVAPPTPPSNRRQLFVMRGYLTAPSGWAEADEVMMNLV